MEQPIRLRKHAIFAEARRHLQNAGRGDELHQAQRAKALTRARENIEHAKEYALLRRQVEQAARSALHAAWRAFALHDRYRAMANVTPTPSERAERAAVEQAFKRIAGL